jgi:hypothetical protein
VYARCVSTSVDPRTVAHPFLLVRQVAYFLGVSVERVRTLHRRGDLPEATLAKGQPFRPNRAMLFPAPEVAALLEGDYLLEFLAWQRGSCEIDFSGS